jgi:hypothetical protein
MTEIKAFAVLRGAVFGLMVLEDPMGFDAHPMDRGAFLDLAADRSPDVSAGADGVQVIGSRTFIDRGFEVVEERAVTTKGLEFLARRYRGRNRLYTFVVAYPTTKSPSYATAVRSYFDSIRLDPTDARVPAGDGRLDTSRWHYIDPPGDDFAIAMPGNPRISAAGIELGSSEHSVEVYSVGDDVRQFAVMAVELGEPGTPEDIDAMSARLAATGFAIREHHDVQRQGFAGREVIYASGDQLVRCRYFLTDGRIYELRVAAPLSDAEASATASDRFFASFRIL